jgi:hypothetical protein
MYALILAILTTAGPGNVTVPFTYFDNRIVIQCSIDGRGPFSMIVDTGSPDVVVTPETAERLGAKVRSIGMTTGAGNKAVTEGSTMLHSLSIASLSFADMTADVLDLSEIRTRFHFPHLDGIVGYPVLKQFATFIDVDAGTLSFSKTRPVLPARFTMTAFTGVLPVIFATIDGIATTVVVDTGDRSSLTLFGPFATHYAFYGRYPSKKNIITGYGLGGPIYGDVFTLPDLNVLGNRLTNVVTRASRQTGGVFTSTDEGGSIGTGVLKRFNLVLDYPRDVIIAWPSKYSDTRDVFKPPGSPE